MAIVQLDKILAGANGNIESVVVYTDDTYATPKKDFANGLFVALGKLEEGNREARQAHVAKGDEEEILLVHTPELMYDEKKKLRDFVNIEGKKARAYRLAKGDIISFTVGLLPEDVAVDKVYGIKDGKLDETTKESSPLVFTVIEDSGNELDITEKAFALQVTKVHK